MIRLILADDHEIVLAGLGKLIEETDDIEVVAVTRDGRGTLAAVLGGEVDFDVLVLDLSLPGFGGFEVLRRVREERPQARVVILTMYPEEQYAVQLLNSGASGFVSKVSPPETLLTAVRTVASGGTYCSPAVERRRSMAYEQDRDLPHKSLTSREHQVFMLVAEGEGTLEIAAQLNLSASTISNYIAAIKEKLGARTVLDIVKYAHRVGLVD